MKSYQLSRKAEEDLDGIWDYTENTWGVEQAEKYTRDLMETCEHIAADSLQRIPALYVKPAYYKLQCNSHVIFYKEKPSHIYIVRILHKNMDFERHV